MYLKAFVTVNYGYINKVQLPDLRREKMLLLITPVIGIGSLGFMYQCHTQTDLLHQLLM